MASGSLPEMDGVRYVLASPYDEEAEGWESDMDQLKDLMDDVVAKNAAWSIATTELRQSLQALRDAINAILEGLEP